ncbi:beta strand repeat-containing protein [Bradyrhizobium sp. DASA03120]|uniref:beta strand repeat-containing protein n=1 Tax=Bradyrhizobium sp. SMVTL-02 TaxID=3395917 RepID=UPI003F70CE60
MISGITTGSVVEAGGVNNAIAGTPIATGTLTDTDVDNAANTFQAVAAGAATDNHYGTFQMSAGGVWTYTLDNTSAAVQALNAGQHLTDTFTVHTIDGTAQQITVTINGTNDAAVISGTTTGSVVEAGGVNSAIAGTPIATGTLTDTDVDNFANTFQAVAAGAATDNHYGTFQMSAGGVWTYTLDNTNAAVQALNAGQHLTDTFTVHTIDGTAQQITVTITGTNDAPVAQAKTDAATEGGATITGSVVATDVDDGATLTYSLTAAAPAGLTFNADGGYSFDPTVAAYDHLKAGATQDVVVSYKANDGTADSNISTLTITVTGTNDAPVAQAKTDAATEGGATITGSVVATDVDDGATLTYSLTAAAPAGLTFNADGSYSFDPTVAAYDHLKAGATQDVVVSYKANDGTADSNISTLTITVTGTNDAPVAQAKTDAATEGGATITGSVVATDVDDGATLTYSLTAAAPAGLTFNADGSYSFDPTVAAYDHLKAGATQDVVVSYKANDGTADSNISTLTITVTGTNDAPVAQAKTDAATEGGATITGSVVATDVDDGATLTYSLTAAAPAGLTFNADGSYSFDPTVAAYDHLKAGATQDVVVSYKANDGTADSNISTLTITVTGTNDAPVAQAKTDAATEGGATITGSVVATDVDDGATLTYSLTAAAPAGLTFNADGSYSFDPTVAAYDHLKAGATQDVVVSYKANDGTADSNISTLTITVTGTNDAPVAQAKTDAATEGGATITGSVVATDVDDGATLTYSLTAAAPAGLTFNADGSYSFDPTVAAYDHLKAGATQDVVVFNADGSYSFDPTVAAYDHLKAGATQDVVVSYKANDGTADSNISTLTITVTGTNDAPVAQAKTDAATEGGATITGSVVATDVDDGATLTYSLTAAAPAGLTFNADGSYSFDPTVAAYDHLKAGATQDVVVSYKANDGTADSNISTLTITVTGTNDAPVAQAKTDAATEGGATITGSVVATDVDDGATLTYSLTAAAPAGLTFNADGSYSFDPTVAAYDHLKAGATQDVVVSYKANDGTADSNISTLTITVTGTNDAPVAQAKTDAATEGGATITGSVVATDVDDGATLTYSLTAAAPAGLTFNADGSYSFDPTVAAYDHLKAGATQDVVVSYKANDGTADSNISTLTITVTGTNDAPVAQAKTDAATEGGATITGSVVATDVDDGATLTYSLTAAAPAGLTFNADGSYSFDPTVAAYDHLKAGATQDVVVSYKANDGTADSNISTLTITVTGTNDAPVAQAKTDAATEGGATITGSVVATDVDDGATLTYSLTAAAPAGLTFNADGSYSFDPTVAAYDHLKAGATQDVVVSYKANDGTADSNISTLTITVTGTNDAPVAQAKTDAATEGGATITGSVVATDVDDGATLTYSLTAAAPAGLTFNADGSYSFDPTVAAYDHLKAGATQDVVVSYKANDGTADSNISTLTITVTGTNDAPVAQAKTDAATEGGATITGSVVATDVDDGATLTYSLTAAAPAGLTFNADGSYSFDPTVAAYDHLKAGATQDVVVSYKANDGTADSNISTLTITVTGTNDAPVAQAKTDAATEGGATITGSVVATDVDDGATLTYSLTAAAPAGLTFNADGSYSFDPTVAAYDHLKAGATQDVVVSYKANDGTADSNISTLTITVTGTNDAPVAQAKTDAATEGGATITGSVVATDVDDGATLTYSLTAAAPAGLTFNADGSYSFDPTVAAYDHLKAGATQDVVVSYKANDGTADSNISTLTITVTGTNDAPVAQAKTDAATEGGATITGSVVATDVDDGATLTYSLTAAAPAGLTFNADGSYSFDPTVAAYDHLKAGATQDVVVSYKANDGTADSNISTLTITVTGTNDAPVAQAKTDAATEGGATITGSVVATDVDDGATLTYSLTAAAPAGLTFNADGSYSFDPTVAAYDHLKAGATQDVVVSYKANDGTADSNISTLTITVTGTNDAPTLSNLSIAPTSIGFTATDPDNATLALTNPFASAFANPTVVSGSLTSLTPTAQSPAVSGTLQVTDGTATVDVVGLFLGTNGSDSFAATSTATAIYGFDGNDTLTGGTASDWIFGGQGDDTIKGGGGNDTLDGESGNDVLDLSDASAGLTFTFHGGSNGGAYWTTGALPGIGNDSYRNFEGLLGTAFNDSVTLGESLVGTIDLGTGTDSLTLANGGNTLTVKNTETITGGTGNDAIALGAAQASGTIDLGTGTDSLTLANGTNTLTVKNTETITGGTGDDTITLGATQTSGTIDLVSGTDTLNLAAGSNTLSISNVDTVNGSSSNDTLTLTAAFTGGTIDLAGGTADVLNLGNFTNTLTVSNTETITGGTGSDAITLGAAQASGTIDLGAGTDSLTLANGGNTLTVKNTETITGGTGNDAITLGAAQASGTIDLGAGTDSLTLANGGNTLTVSNTETITGGTGSDAITLGAAQASGTIDLGAGTDSLTLANGGNTLTVKNTETITGGTGNDAIALGAAQASGTIDLGTGTDSLTLANGTNTLTVKNTETITGGTGDDTITLGATQTSGTIDLVSGTDTLNLAAGSNTLSISNVDTVNGSSSNDTLTLTAAFTGGTIDLAGGTADVLNLGNFTNTLTVSNTETITGGTGSDAITLGAAQASGTIDLGAGTDSLTLANGGNTLTVSNTETITGGTGNDAITLGAAQASGTIDLGAGTDSLTLANGGNTLTVSNTETITGGTGNDAITLGTAQASGTINLGAGTDSLTLANGGNTLTVSNTETITGGTGADRITVDATDSTINTGQGSDTVFISAGTTLHTWAVDLGSDSVTDKVVFSHASVGVGDNTLATISNFNVANDQVAVTLNSTQIANGAFQTISSLSTNATGQVLEIVTNTSASLTVDSDGGAIEGIIASAIKNLAKGDYTVVVYSSNLGTADAGIYTMNVPNNSVQNGDAGTADFSIEHIMTLSGVGFGNLGSTNFSDNTPAPAGAAGSPINLGLIDPAAGVSPVTVNIAGVPIGWSLSEGTLNADLSWTVSTYDVGSLSITSPLDFTGALLLNITETWSNADGTSGYATSVDNVEAYAPGSPIFAWSGNDTLTGSTGQDLFVFSQPIGNDVVHTFDVSSDVIDLISYGWQSFNDVQTHTSEDASGNAVIMLADGQTITLEGVHTSDLTGSNFEFDVTPQVDNSGAMTIGNGAMLPLSGDIHNTGTIELNSNGDTTDLQLIQHGITLHGGGTLVLSDSNGNLIEGTAADVTLTNVDNTISGAGHLGNGFMVLINEGNIIATVTNALEIDTGANTITNSGTLEATGTGGLVIDSAVSNTGLLWANGGNITAHADVNGGSALITGSATLELGGASSTGVTFDAVGNGLLQLDHAINFSGLVSGFNAGDQIDLHDILSASGASASYTANDAGTGGTLSVTDGVHTANIGLLGQYTSDEFELASDGAGGTLIKVHVSA